MITPILQLSGLNILFNSLHIRHSILPLEKSYGIQIGGHYPTFWTAQSVNQLTPKEGLPGIEPPCGGALNTLYAKSYSLLYLNNGLPSSTSLCSLELSAVNGLDATTLFPHKQKDHSNTSTAYFSPCAK